MNFVRGPLYEEMANGPASTSGPKAKGFSFKGRKRTRCGGMSQSSQKHGKVETKLKGARSTFICLDFLVLPERNLF